MNPLSRITSGRQWDVLRILRARPGLTRADLAQLTGLSISQVSRVTGELIAAGLVAVDAQPDGGLGRPPEALRLAPGAWWVVGLEVGGGRLRGAIADLGGAVGARAEAAFPPAGTVAEAADALGAMARRLAAEAGVDPGTVIGLGLGLYAVVDPIEGRVLEWSEDPAGSAWWRSVPLRDELGGRLGIATVAIDDAVRMRAIAEPVPPGNDYLYLLADSGIGGAMVIGGRPYLAPSRLAGDIGHVVVEPDGPPCPCGSRGCLEAVASSRAVERDAARLLPGETPAIAEIVRRAEAGDAPLRALLVRAGERLGEAMAPVVTMLYPDALVVGGSVASSPLAMEALRSRLHERVHLRVPGTVRVVTSVLGDDAGTLGAVSAALDLLFAGTAQGEPAPAMMTAAAGPRVEAGGRR